jgi:hypothetical protein
MKMPRMTTEEAIEEIRQGKIVILGVDLPVFDSGKNRGSAVASHGGQ